MVHKVVDLVYRQLRSIKQCLLAPFHRRATSKEAGRLLTHRKTRREGNSEVICQTIHLGNSGGGRSRWQGAADGLQGRVEVQRSRGLPRKETPKDNGGNAPEGTKVHER